ncbi:dockerin type 1 [Pelomyxa schiedti]|nr:dockerin type 1 [Pelomyxa schiedti]
MNNSFAGTVGLVFALACVVAASTTITLKGTSIAVSGSGVTVKGTVATITTAGQYIVTGTLNDGQLVVDSTSDGTVEIVLQTASITCSTGSALLVNQSDDTLITLYSETTNTLSDASTYSNPDDSPNAALFSHDVLTISGTGKLYVNGNWKDGITSKDGLMINQGTIIVNAVDDGVRGKDYLILSGSLTYLTVTAGGDAIKSDNAESGDITIQEGEYYLKAGGLGVYANRDLYFFRGDIQITSTGMGLRADNSLTITDGTLVIDSMDDCIHSPNSVVINSPASLTLMSGDDGIHADVIAITGGDIDISECFEGIDGTTITIAGGTIHINSDDDGINSASNSTNTLEITGGYIYIDALGDGIDINGAITMRTGTVIVNGAESSSHAAVEYDTSFTLDSGFLIGASSCEEARTSSAGSQRSILAEFYTAQAPGTLFRLVTSSGQGVATFAPSKMWQAVAFSSSSLLVGSKYSIYYGGSCTGTPTDGLYPTDCTYTAGTLLTSFTISSTVTKVGASCSSY